MKKLLSLLLVLSTLLVACSAALAAGPVGTEFHDGLVWYLDRTSGLYGYLDTKGNVVIKPQFTKPVDFCNGLVPYYNASTKRYGYMDTNGKTVIKAEYKEAQGFSKGAAVVMASNDKFAHYFLIGPDGKTVVKNLDKDNWFYSDHVWYGDYCIAATRYWNGKRFMTQGYAYITANGTVIMLDRKIAYAMQFSDDGIAVVGTYDLNKGTSYQRFVNSDGIEYLYGSGGPLATTFYYIDKNGKQIGNLTFTEPPKPFSEGFAPIQTYSVKGTPTWSYINTRGETVITGNFSEVNPFSDGMALVCTGGKYGYIDTTGTLVIPATYSGGLSFQNGLAGVKKVIYWGVIDKEGNVVLPAEYSSVSVTGNLIVACKWGNTSYDIYNRQGQLLHENMSTSVCSETSAGTVYTVFQNGLYGYMTEDGKMIFEPQFQRAGAFSSDAAIAWKNSEWFIIDCNGNIVY